MSDSLNWEYTASFAEGGKYKHVASFYDGLLKNRQSITRFNSSLDKLLRRNCARHVKTVVTGNLCANANHDANQDKCSYHTHR